MEKDHKLVFKCLFLQRKMSIFCILFIAHAWCTNVPQKVDQTDSSKSPFCAMWFNATQVFTALFGVCFYLQQSLSHLVVFGGFSVCHDFVCGVLISLMFYCVFLVWRWSLTVWCLIQFVFKLFFRIPATCNSFSSKMSYLLSDQSHFTHYTNEEQLHWYIDLGLH